MTEQKEFESLDELFRKTFDNLPDTPAKSGWDAPSEKVWQHVQAQIKPPKSGWSTQTITLLAAFAVTLTVGLYLLLSRAEKPAPPTAVPPVAAIEKTELPADNATENTTDTQASVAPPTPTLSPVKTLKKKKTDEEKIAAADVKKAESEAAKTTPEESATDDTRKAIGKKPPSPNTIERRKAELAQNAEKAWKTPLQTLPQYWPGKPKN